MRVTFAGAAGTVTGSRYLVETATTRVLVDCGLFQGGRELRARNREPLPFAVSDVDAVLLTHAHIDHSGYVPVVVPRRTFVTHGEPEASRALADRLQRELNHRPHVPEFGERVELEPE